MAKPKKSRARPPSQMVSVFKRALAKSWSEEFFQMSAALAYYTLFSSGPILLLLVSLVGFIIGEAAAREVVFEHIRGFLGPEMTREIESLFAAAERPNAGVVATLIGFVSLVFIAGSAFSQLRHSLNKILQCAKQRPTAIGFVWRRLTAVVMVFALSVLIFISLVVDTLISATGIPLEKWLFLPPIVFGVGSISLSVVLMTAALSGVFRYLPDVQLPRRPVIVGAAVAAVLIEIGAYLLGLYLGRNALASPYGAAGSIIVILLSAYYFAQAIFFGAQTAHSWNEKVSPQ